MIDIETMIDIEYDELKSIAQQLVNELDWSPLANAVAAAVGIGPPPPPLPDLLLAPSFLIVQPTTNPPGFHAVLASDAQAGDVIRWQLASNSSYSLIDVEGVYTLLASDVSHGFALVGPTSTVTSGLRWPRIRAERDTLISSYTTAASITVPITGPFDPLITIPEMVLQAWFQEDVAEGALAEWPTNARAVRSFTAAQADTLLQPTKLPSDGGVLFAKDTAQNLQWPTDSRAYLFNRWWLVIARCDIANNPSVPLQRVFTVNHLGNNNAYQQPHVYFNCTNSTLNSRIYSGGIHNEEALCSSDTWNVMVGYRRGWMLQTCVNGVKSAGRVVTAQFANNGNDPSMMGMPSGNLADMAIDCILIGCGELTDDLIDKLTGWAAHRRSINLPAEHPYASAPPNGDGSDDLPRYRHDVAFWLNYGNTPEFQNKYADFGNPGPSTDGYSTVFFDDFTTDSIVHSAAGPGNIWYAPPFLGTINHSAIAANVGQVPPCYVWDGVSASALRLLHDGKWKSGAYASVDRNGRGRYWGKGIFEIRCKFPTDKTPGFFPAFWSYGREHIIWPTRNRIELDYFEYDNVIGSHINTAILVHENDSAVPFTDPTVRKSGEGKSSWKPASRQVTVAEGFPHDVDIYDGQYHTWRVQIEDDFTYVCVDDFLVSKVPTTKEYTIDKYILVDWAYRAAFGTADPLQTYDMTVDYIKVMQKETELQTVPSAFNALPALTGTFAVGNTITCDPNVDASQIEFEWYRDGSPIIGAVGGSYQLTAADEGHAIRVHVKAESLYGQPHAWSLESATVA